MAAHTPPGTTSRQGPGVSPGLSLVAPSMKPDEAIKPAQYFMLSPTTATAPGVVKPFTSSYSSSSRFSTRR